MRPITARHPVPGLPLAFALALGLASAGCASAPARTATRTDDPDLATAYRVLSTTPLIDGHNDLPWAIRSFEAAPMDLEAYDLRQPTPGHTDIERLRKGMVGGQFWSVYVPPDAPQDHAAARIQLEQIDLTLRMIERYPETFELATSPADVVRIFESGKIAAMLGMEGGHAIENSLGALRAFYDLGARYMTLTHSLNVDWADSCCEAPELGGLSPFGEEVVREMNRLGMLVDISHVSPETMSDVLDVSEAPVIFSHSSAYAVTAHPRNVPDAVLRRVRDNGGVVMVTFVTVFVNEELRRWAELPPDERPQPVPGATLEDVVDHIEHVRDVAGVDHIGIGGDFDGATVPTGLDDVSAYPALFAELSRRGWTEEELRKLAGENILRVWRDAERVGERLRAERPASVATFAQLDRLISGGAGGFVTRLGADTLAVESFRYTSSSFDAEVVLRVPETVLTLYHAELDPQGFIRRLVASAFEGPELLAGVEPDPVARTTWEFVGDSVHLTAMQDGRREQVTAAAEPGSIPFIDMVHWPFELALMRLEGTSPLGESEAEVPMLVGRRTLPFGFARPDAGRVLIRHPYRGTMSVETDAVGRILALDAAETTRAVTVERVEAPDVWEIARGFAAAEARGEGLGELSGRGEAEGRIGDATVVVDYGVPRKRGREIFGALVPYGEVWRTGANRATHLSTDRALWVGDTRLPAGTYTLFTVPGPDTWTLIVNERTDINGTAYDATADLARIPMEARPLDGVVEEFTIRVDPAGLLRLQWDRTEAVVPLRPAP